MKPIITPIIYVTRDIERALGMDPNEAYIVIANKTRYSLTVQEKFPSFVFLVESVDPKIQLDTYDILMLPDVQSLISEKKADILVFKNTKRIEILCAEKKWTLLNPSAELAEKIENKISQVEWLGDARKYLPLHKVGTVTEIFKDIYPTNDPKKGFFAGEPFIMQWAHSHTGEGTALISSGEKGKKEFNLILSKFPDRDIRVTQYIQGPVFTVNVCTSGTKTRIGNISYQITGILPFTENPFSTVGNDWTIPHSILTEEQISAIKIMADEISQKMHIAGWKGLFGIDCIYDMERDSLNLIEINARQPASTTYESTLQHAIRPHIPNGMTTFEAHMNALQNKDVKMQEIIEINDGAQILERVTLFSQKKNADDIAATALLLRTKQYNVIEYDNIKINNDLLRIQSSQGIMETHNKFNKRGKEILAIITGIAEENY